MTAALKRSLKPNFKIFDNASDAEIYDFVKTTFGPEFFALEMDAPNYDATQSPYTRMFETTIWSMFATNKISLSTYMALRNNPRYYSIFVNCLWGQGRPSGAPDTMCGNIMVMMIIVAMMFSPKELLAGGFKGDDTILKTLYNEIQMDMYFYKLFFPVPLKMKTCSNATEFCNYIHSAKGYIYNPYLFFGKYVINKDYKTVCLNQAKFDEFMDAVKVIINPIRENYYGVIETLMIRYKMERNVAEIIVKQMDAFAKLTLEEFPIYLSLDMVTLTDAISY